MAHNENEHLSLDVLFNMLQWGASSDQEKVSLASHQLRAWQSQPDFHRFLQQIVGNQTLAFEVRWLAAIQLKNGIDRFWRKTAVCAISKEEKDSIRKQCIEIGMNEPDRRLALQNALFMAKIVRVDYPHDWPNAIYDLLQAMKRSASRLEGSPQLTGSLLLLLMMVKELSSARLMRTRKSLNEDGPEVLKIVFGTYTILFDTWQSLPGAKEAAVSLSTESLDQSLLCLRVLRRILVTAFERPSKSKEVCDCWAVLSQHFSYFIRAMKQPASTGFTSFIKPVQKIVLQMAKLHVSMIESHPASFPQLPNAVLLVKLHWSALKDLGDSFGPSDKHLSFDRCTFKEESEETSQFAESLGLKGLLLLRGCVRMVYDPVMTIKYQTIEDKEERLDSKNVLKQEIFSEILVKEMMEIIITQFFMFRSTDLARWKEEPLEWERQEESEGDSWKYSIRICAEKLLLDLVLNHKDLLINPLINVFHMVATSGTANIFLKDSMYGAIGLCAPILTGRVDFNAFMMSTLIPELHIEHEDYRIIRRRASIMIGQWASIGGLDASIVFQIFQHLLDSDSSTNDLVVRITAGRQLKNVIDPYEASMESLRPFATTLLRRTMALIEEADIVETKISLLETIQTLVQLMDNTVTQFADLIYKPLPKIWRIAEDEYLLKQAILSLLGDLLKSMKAESVRFHSMIIPLITNALENVSNSRHHLLEDTLDLWALLLSQAPSSTRDISALFPHIIPLFETADENLRRALEITDSYILLSPYDLLEDGANVIWGVLTALMSQPLRRDARVSVCGMAERLLTVAHSTGGSSAVARVVANAENVGFMKQIFLGLLEAFQAHQNPSPKASKTEINGIVETSYWRVLARIMIGDPKIFANLVLHMSAQISIESAKLTQDLLTELFSHYDNLCAADVSKLMALGLAALLMCEDISFAEQVGSRLQDLLIVWTSTVHECTFDGKDTLIWNDMEALLPPDAESPEQGRLRELEYSEPVRRISIRDAVAVALKEFSSKLGSRFDDLVASTDRDVMEQFQTLNLFNWH